LSLSETTDAAARSWNALLARYKPDTRRSVLQLVLSATLFIGTWVLMYLTHRQAYWLTLLLSVPAAFFLIRLFIIQHDCGHGSFFRSAKLADAVGSLIGVVSLTPYHYWKKTHAIHHATSGNLEHRGFGDIDTRTVEEYLALSRWGRFTYRLYRHPITLFVVGAAVHFVVKHRIPTIVPREWKRERWSILWTDIVLAGLVATAGLLIGFKSLLMIQLPLTLLACSLGVWLFYVQHQFEPTYWEHDTDWRYSQAALEGSSFYKLPKVLHWLTGNIGFHHIHHLNARIPNYRLPEVFANHPELNVRVTQLTLWQSLRSATLTLWDEQQRRLIGFRELRRR
jgi:omega-6 fatty acid desaturase (delta-12 desaturase)